MSNGIIFSTNPGFWQRMLGMAMRGFSVNVKGRKVQENDFKIELVKVDDNPVMVRSSCIIASGAYSYYEGVEIRTIAPAFAPGKKYNRCPNRRQGCSEFG